MFGTKIKPLNNGDPTVKLRVSLYAALADAIAGGVDRRPIADLLEGRAVGLRVRDANLRPIM
jgi:hypothetical protein